MATKTGETTVALGYGPSGVGKTTEQGYSFPRALFAAAPGALNSIKSTCGYYPAQTQVGSIEEATELIKAVANKFQWLVIDDFSFLAEQTFAGLERKKKGFQLWGALRDVALDFRDTARYAKVNVIMNAWEQVPKVTPDGTKVRGGPMLSGRLPEQIPALCDIVVRAIHEPARQPWPAAYQCSMDPNWVMKDRFNIASQISPAPMNMAELLRAAGMDVPRHPDLPDQEETVEALANHFEELTGVALATEANVMYKKLRDAGSAVSVARWTLRDALDRAEIRRALKKASDNFMSVPTNALL